MRTLMTAVTAIVIMAAPAYAADGASERAGAYTAILDCRNLSDNAARLACFDRAVASFAALESSGEVIVLKKSDALEMKRAAAMSDNADRRTPETPKKIEAVLAGVRELPNGKWEFTLDNGMRWRQTDTQQIFPVAGTAVTVRAAALGSYMMEMRRRMIRVSRIS